MFNSPARRVRPALRSFYVGVLGLTGLPKPPVLAARGGCWFDGRRLQLPRVEADFRPAREAHPVALAFLGRPPAGCRGRLRGAMGLG
jgi:hypothetical protein